jgi:nicotinate-nucleotide adenylyltransferase
MKVGLFFGSFNPIHVGHLIIANHLAEHSNLDQIWMVVTPHNPLKEKKSLLDDYHRLHLVSLATDEYLKIKSSDFEFKLPQPNFTVNTLAHFQEKFPKNEFSLIIGEDNLKNFKKWKNYEVILENHFIYVYPRIDKSIDKNQKHGFENHSKIIKIDAPIVEISSTYIRENIKSGKNVKPLLSTEVWNYIEKCGFYLK